MKKHLLILCIAYIAIAAYAQNSIPNGNFENWTTNSFDYPQNYTYTSITDYSLFSNPNVVKTTDAHNGTYAVQISNATDAAKDTINGYILNFDPSSSGGPSTWHGGIPYSEIPTGINGWYKYNVDKTDSGTIIVVFSKAGANIGTYMFLIGGIQNSYTQFNFTFKPALTITPDSVIFATTAGKLVNGQLHGVPGSVLKLDDISFTGVTSQPYSLNGDFESWQTQTINTLDNWYYNGDPQAKVLSVLKTTDTYRGNYAVELKTVLRGNQVEPGQISTGYYPNNCHGNCYELGGYAYSNIKDTLVFYYKYAPAGKDSAWINLNFIKNGNNIDGRGTPLLASATYQYKELAFELGQSPDTVIVQINSSNNGNISNVGSDLKIDNIYFKSQVATGIKTKQVISQLYPNPAIDNVTIESPDNISSVLITDILGKMVREEKLVNGTKTSFSVNGLHPGLYFVTINTSSNSKIVKKLIVKEK